MTQERPSDLDKVFKALGNETRRKILQLLAQGARYPYDLANTLDLTPRGAFKHLEVLREAGLVEREHGESNLGPDRVYYRLNVRFGLSTTILPDTFVVRLTRRDGMAGRIRIPHGFIIPEARSDVLAVRKLLSELGRVNKRLMEIDDERMRFASLRGQIIKRIETIMSQCNWDDESCRQVRSLLDRSLVDSIEQTTPSADDAVTETWTDIMKQTLDLFERLFSSRSIQLREKDELDEEDDEEIELDIE
ncbi:MAG: helix-turn-helix domain-containing protein [Candidatus Thorarchaeota archaeon]|nr:helix-turn-helix domain-containing protein [Candidatus Thorarchaeota archaeon]